MGDGKRLLLPDHMTWKESGGRGTAKQHSPPSTFLMAEGHLILRVVLACHCVTNKKGLHTPPLSSFFSFAYFSFAYLIVVVSWRRITPPQRFLSPTFSSTTANSTTRTPHTNKNENTPKQTKHQEPLQKILRESFVCENQRRLKKRKSACFSINTTTKHGLRFSLKNCSLRVAAENDFHR